MRGAAQYSQKLKIFFLLASFFVLSSAFAGSNSSFSPIKLPRGIELQIPKGWQLLGSEYNQAIKASAEAAIDLADISLPTGKDVNLITATSMLYSTYAAVRVNSLTPPPYSLYELAAVTTDNIRELQVEIREGLQKVLPHTGSQLIDFFGSRVERVSGYPTFVTEYRRTGSEGPVFVQINQIITHDQEVKVVLSYRESEATFWKPVIGKIRKSIIVNK